MVRLLHAVRSPGALRALAAALLLCALLFCAGSARAEAQSAFFSLLFPQLVPGACTAREATPGEASPREAVAL